jgi:hypothetical protein
MRLGEFLREQRERAGVTARHVYETLGIPKPTFYAWEAERTLVDPIDIRRVLEFYGSPESVISRALDLRSREAPASTVTP